MRSVIPPPVSEAGDIVQVLGLSVRPSVCVCDNLAINQVRSHWGQLSPFTWSLEKYWSDVTIPDVLQALLL